MGSNSKIEWCHNTFNPWYGCSKVSQACKFCYAVRTAARLGVKWGDDAPRRAASERMWQQPLVWDRRAKRTGRRERVFCASLADVFEDRYELEPWRLRLFETIAQTSSLDWLLLTKRPQHIQSMAEPLTQRFGGRMPSNVWLGTTVETNEHRERIQDLVAQPAAVHFVSAEPLLEEIDLRPHLPTLDWIIAGGESGSVASRPSHPDWVRALRDQCTERVTPVPFFFKQWGDWLPTDQSGRKSDRVLARVLTIARRVHSFEDETAAVRVGKKEAGRLLDGREWNEHPKQVRLVA